MDPARLVASFLSLLPPVLFAVGLYFAVRLRFFPLFHPLRTLRALLGTDRKEGRERNAVCPTQTEEKTAFRDTRPPSNCEKCGKCVHKGSSKEPKKKASAFRAASVAIAGTVGVGNIAGVSLALLTGGAGSVFWMWVCGILAMFLKYAEVTLAMDSRRPDGRGGFLGGTFYSLRAAGWGALAPLFAVLMLTQNIIVGGMVQANAVSDCLFSEFACPPPLTGAALVLLTLPVILGGREKISGFTVKLVPLMCLLYLGTAGAVILANAARIPDAMASILADAFAPDAAAGGVLGFLGSRAIRVGVARGLVSNEGGCGTAPTAHASSSEPIPARQGLFGILEVFADTVVICTLTALAILTAVPAAPAETGGMALVSAAFRTALGGAAPLLLAGMLLFFAYATLLSASFYAEGSLRFLGLGDTAARTSAFVFCFFVFCGAVGTPSFVWTAADLILGLMTLLNLALLLHRRQRILDLTRDAGYIH